MAEINGTGHSAEMSPGVESQFDVEVDGRLAFSKRQVGRFPELAEILAELV